MATEQQYPLTNFPDCPEKSRPGAIPLTTLKNVVEDEEEMERGGVYPGGNEDGDDEEAEDSDSDTMGTSVNSWNSETESPSSCETDAEISFTIGPTESSPYACQFCEKAFPRLSFLKKHEQSHQDMMPFKCDFCQRLFKHKRSRDRHVKLHTGDKKYRCPHCESAFSRSDHLKIHLKTHDHQKPYQCVVCNRGYNTAAALTSHMQNHKKENSSPRSSPGQFRCLQCNATFPTGEELQGHVSSHHNSSSKPNTPPAASKPSASSPELFGVPKLACIYCAKDNFLTMEALQLHVQALHGPLLNGALSTTPSPDLQLPCTLCTMKFPTISLLQKHILTMHSLFYFGQKAKENAFCAPCSVAFPNNSAYAEHLVLFHNGFKTETPPPQPALVASSSSASSPTDLTSKSRSSPTTSKRQKLLCSQCNAGFSDFESFRSHLKGHLDPAGSSTIKHTCDQCDSEFNSEEQLESHSITHYLATTTEYGCQSCLKLFQKPDELQKHLLDIHAHHLYRCALCKEVFDSKVSIQVHFAVKHSNECKLFRCLSCCDAVFRSEVEFQLHIRLVHMRKANSPYRCLLCNSCFLTDMELQFHLSTHQKQFQCKFCDESFHIEFLLDKHMQLHHVTANGTSSNTKKPHNSTGSRKFRCEICDKTLPSEEDVILHRKQTHNVADTNSSSPNKTTQKRVLSLNCAYCNESCKSRSDLENHMKTHQQQCKNKCNICDEMLPTATLLAEHKLTHCKVIQGNKCTGCKKSLNTEDLYMEHMREHNSGAGFPSPCVICRQTLMTDVEIQMHSKFHTSSNSTTVGSGAKKCCLCLEDSGSNDICTGCLVKKKTYQCIKCQKSFASEEEIESHVASHLKTEGVGCNECLLCNSVFDSPMKLQCHLIEHTFEGCGSFTCYMCSSVFTTPTGLQHHMIEHGLASRPYDCPNCRLKFFFRAELDNHIRSHRKDHEEKHGAVDLSSKQSKKPKFFYRSDSEDEEDGKESPKQPKLESDT